MKHVSLFLCLAVASFSLSGCGLLGAVGRTASSILRVPGNLLNSVTEAEQADPAPADVITEEEIDTANIAVAPLD